MLYVIGPGRELEDFFGDWAEAREISETGCLLVLPDAHVAWRKSEVTDTAVAELLDALGRLLGRSVAE